MTGISVFILTLGIVGIIGYFSQSFLKFEPSPWSLIIAFLLAALLAIGAMLDTNWWRIIAGIALIISGVAMSGYWIWSFFATLIGIKTRQYAPNIEGQFNFIMIALGLGMASWGIILLAREITGNQDFGRG